VLIKRLSSKHPEEDEDRLHSFVCCKTSKGMQGMDYYQHLFFKQTAMFQVVSYLIVFNKKKTINFNDFLCDGMNFMLCLEIFCLFVCRSYDYNKERIVSVVI